MQSFIPTPLHPAIVHLPIALSVLLPFFAIGTMVAIGRGARPLKAWGITTALFAALTLSSWLAVETGEQQTERVEQVIAEAPIETHEEAAEAFLLFSLGVLGVAAVGLTSGKLGTVARVAGTVGALALVGAGYQVGQTGGKLVYQYGAASAYTDGNTVVRAGEVTTDRATTSDDDDR
ncbi:MAG: hypothetical protein IPF47_20010 [Gemmatimonadetes bacterium]|nr:hypothetical protein [Gemmatimonadota bacterium]